jgi:hypothetical protein
MSNFDRGSVTFRSCISNSFALPIRTCEYSTSSDGSPSLDQRVFNERIFLHVVVPVRMSKIMLLGPNDAKPCDYVLFSGDAKKGTAAPV